VRERETDRERETERETERERERETETDPNLTLPNLTNDEKKMFSLRELIRPNSCLMMKIKCGDL
jgi:hypothetical protein